MATHVRITAAQMIRQYKQRTTTLADGSKFIPLDKGLCDVFTGIDWLQQSRYRYAKARWLYVSGNRLANSWLLDNMPVARTTRLH